MNNSMVLEVVVAEDNSPYFEGEAVHKLQEQEGVDVKY